MDVVNLVDKYINNEDWRVRENANRRYGFGSLKAYIAESILKEWMLERVHQDLAYMHADGWWHAHDIHAFLYCCGYNIRRVLERGIIANITSRKPRHFSSALGQIVNFVFMVQQDHAGAIGLGRLDLELAPYVARDQLSPREVKQNLQEFIYNLNMDMRAGLESPFTNITLDFCIPESMRNREAYVGDEVVGSYEEFREYQHLIDEVLMEIYLEGDAVSRPFKFPIPTVNVTKDFDFDNYHSLWKVTAKYGTPYFCNMINTDMNPDDIMAMCCRLNINLEEIKNAMKVMRYGGLFGMPDGTGSVCVTTVNMPRLGWECRSEESRLFEKLDEILDKAYTLMLRRRAMCEIAMNKGLLPTFKEYVGTIKWHFNTFSIVGVHECLLNFGIEDGIISEDGWNFAERILQYINKRVEEYSKLKDEPITVSVNSQLYTLEWRGLCNFEQAPAESASYRLKQKDIQKYGTKLPAFEWWKKIVGEDWIHIPYTNSTHLPVVVPWNVHEIIKHQERLNKYYTGGSVVHIWIGEAVADWSVREFVKNVCCRTKLPYFTITPTLSICSSCREVYTGTYENCPKCGENVEIWSRVVGYYSRVDLWNIGKKTEFRWRVYHVLRK